MATSQPLETIPEEPTATPTPARVTADPPKTKPAKNPKRVAAGKKLAERNRRVREVLEQIKQEEDEEAAAATDSKSDTTTNGSGLSLVAVLGIGGLIVSLLSVYYQREAIMARLKPAPPAPPAPAPTPAPSRIPVKRGIKEME